MNKAEVALFVYLESGRLALRSANKAEAFWWCCDFVTIFSSRGKVLNVATNFESLIFWFKDSVEVVGSHSCL